MDFNYPNGGASVYVFGPTYGLIDHNNFISSYESAILTGLQLTSTMEGGSISSLKGSFAASSAYQPGGAQNCLYRGQHIHRHGAERHCGN